MGLAVPLQSRHRGSGRRAPPAGAPRTAAGSRATVPARGRASSHGVNGRQRARETETEREKEGLDQRSAAVYFKASLAPSPSARAQPRRTFLLLLSFFRPDHERQRRQRPCPSGPQPRRPGCAPPGSPQGKFAPGSGTAWGRGRRARGGRRAPVHESSLPVSFPVSFLPSSSPSPHRGACSLPAGCLLSPPLLLLLSGLEVPRGRGGAGTAAALLPLALRLRAPSQTCCAGAPEPALSQTTSA